MTDATQSQIAQTISDGFDRMEARVSAAIDALSYQRQQRAHTLDTTARMRRKRARFAATPLALLPRAVQPSAWSEAATAVS